VNLKADHLIRTLPPNLPLASNNAFSTCCFCNLRSDHEFHSQITIQDRVILGEYKWVILGERSGLETLTAPDPSQRCREPTAARQFVKTFLVARFVPETARLGGKHL